MAGGNDDDDGDQDGDEDGDDDVDEHLISSNVFNMTSGLTLWK